MASALGSLTAESFTGGVFSNTFGNSSQSLRNSTETIKVLNEVKSPLIEMSEFFAGIDSGIIKLVNIAKESLGLDKDSLQLEARIADIMKSDLALEEKENLADQLRGRNANISGANTDKDGDGKPKKLNFVDSLKKALDDLTSSQTASELLKIFLFATGALALAKFGLKFKDQISSVLKFINESVIPGIKDLNKDIESYLGLGGLSKLSLFLKIASPLGALSFAITKFIIDPFGKIAKNIKGARLGLQLQLALFKEGSFFKSISNFFTPVGKRIKEISKSFKSGLSMFSKLSGLSSLLKIGGLFLRFIAWPLQLVIGLFGGLTAGLKKFKEGGGMFEVLGAFMVGVYDIIVGSTLNLVADIAGWVVKKLGFESLGQSIQDMDFTFDGIMTGIINLKNTIADWFTNSLNFLKSKVFGTEFVKVDSPKLVTKAVMAKRAEGSSVPPSQKVVKLNDAVGVSSSELETANKIDLTIPAVDSSELKTAAIADFEKLDNKLVLDKSTTSMITKNESLLASVAVSEAVKNKSSSTPVIVDNKQITGGTTVNNSKTTVNSNQAVEHSDRATKELNSVYGYAIA